MPLVYSLRIDLSIKNNHFGFNNNYIYTITIVKTGKGKVFSLSYYDITNLAPFKNSPAILYFF
jgi:hypothetical protein